MIGGLASASAGRIVEARAQQVFDSTEDLALRAKLELHEMKLLAAANALAGLSGHRRQQVWEAAGPRLAPGLLREVPVNADFLELDAAPEGEEIVFGYASIGLTLRRHPLARLRERLAGRGLMTARDLDGIENGAQVSHCGIVTLRQQPETAKGTIFVTLEDETGSCR